MKIITYNEEANQFILADNPEYKDGNCNKSGAIESTIVKISTFDYNNPLGIFGTLYKADDIVIPDQKILLTITFPVVSPIDIAITSHSPKGFTLRELIKLIKDTYEYVYDEEEKTSSPQTYTLRKKCEKCMDINLKDYVQSVDGIDDCPICYSNSSDSFGRLNCSHTFHKECIIEWIRYGGKNCPLCRDPIYRCEECKGVGWIQYEYTGVVIPIEHRGDRYNRNTTYGRFGIWGYDLDDLYLEGMWYNRKGKNLVIFVGS